MDTTIAIFLAQDGLITGAIYALLAVAIVLLFTVTRVIFVPQGDFVAFAALTMAMFQTGKMPGTVWLLVALSAVALVMEVSTSFKRKDQRGLLLAVAQYGLSPVLLAAAIWILAPMKLPMAVQVFMSLAIIVPMGPLLYRVVYQPIAHASVLVLLIVSVAVHLALTGGGLVMFGPEGSRTPAFNDERFSLGSIQISGQSLWVLGLTLLAIAGLYWLFNHTFRGKALKATAVNRKGAELMGISTTGAGKFAFTLAAGIGALSGLLIAPITTIYYDTGFLIGLKGFVAAIIGGLVGYPLAAAGAILVGMLEAFSSFWASAFKEVIVFTLILPVLLWRSLRTTHVEEDEE